MQPLLKKYSLPIIACAAIFIIACQKNVSNSEAAKTMDGNGLYFSNSSISINQAVFFRDTVGAHDSTEYAPGKHYVWSVLPSGCDSISYHDGYGNTTARVIFRCPGTYTVTASIYDDANNIVGHTDTAIIKVGNDTLPRVQPIYADDELTIMPVYERFLPLQHSANWDSGTVRLWYSTKRIYTADILNYSWDNYSSYTFTDARLNEYPFEWKAPGKITGVIDGLWRMGQYGPDSTTLTINWLGKTYTGIVKIDGDKFTFDWPYTEGVIINPKQNW